jgi:5'-methylthioadenosine phosphorylase
MTMRIGIIGGSGLYDLDVFRREDRVTVPTPFGNPSDPLEIFEVNGREVVFLARHGKGHRLLPTEINYRANIWALKILGVTRILSVSAVGSFKKEIQPTDIVLIDQFYDRTNQARKMTFFGDGLVAHISFENPLCGELRRVLFEAGHEEGLGAKIHWGGTYLNIEGPAFSCRAESKLHKSWGFDVVGMTNVAEAKLAREAEMCYATLAMVTDYDSWVDDKDDNLVSSDVVVECLRKNNESVRKIIVKAMAAIPEERRCSCGSALQHAIATSPESVPKEAADRLDPIIGRYLRRT